MAVVVEVAESVAGAFGVLDDEVGAFDGAVGEAGEVPAEQFGFPVGDGGGESGDLGDVCVGGVLVELDEAAAAPCRRLQQGCDRDSKLRMTRGPH